MSRNFRILFLCVGNVCRSPMAERLLRLRIAEHAAAAGPFIVSSGGTWGMVGRAMTTEAAAEVVARGGVVDGFVARRLEPHLVVEADLILTATTDVRRACLEEVPFAMRRTFTWKEFAALVTGSSARTPCDLVADAAARRAEVAVLGLDTDDPIGRPRDVYARVAREIDDAISVIARALIESTAHDS